ncbi:MAG: flotillin domain-containing protein [Azospirillaceae bacterium]
MSVVIIVVIVFVAIVAMGIVLARLYVRAPKDEAFVRTGLGGAKVVLDGGALKLPVFHDVTWVNMRTLRLEVHRRREQAMITFDRMRVDIGVEFYVRVRPNKESIALAAQTLGERTLESEQLRELVEAKFVDALRGVAAKMSLDDLHEKRQDFVQSVQNAVAADLEQNGLELESVSLTALDQTSSEFFNPNNAFDAQGLTFLTQITEAKRKERNELEQAARIAIEERNLAAEQRSIDIKREEEYARLDAQRDVANRSASTKAETAEKEAEAHRVEQEAKIASDQQVRQRQIDSDREVDQRRITSERDVRLSEQEKAIAIAERSRAEFKAAAEAEAARAESVKAEEDVKTVARVAEAERQRQVILVEARQEAERQAVAVTVQAQAEREAAEDEALAITTDAKAKADAVRIQADADERRLAVEAEGQRAINAARNVVDDRVIQLELKLALIQSMPQIMEASLKPVEKIKDIRILDMGGRGLPGGYGETGNGHLPHANGSNGTLPDQLIDALMRYRMQAPVIDELLKELGLPDGANLPKVLSAMAGGAAATGATAAEDTTDAAPTAPTKPAPSPADRGQATGKVPRKSS